MKKAMLCAAIALMALTGPAANALQTEEVLDLVAMPLAVAAVSDVTGIPSDSLVDLAVAMNMVDVPPAQFVEVVRYSPVLLIEPDREVEVVTYVTTEVERGITSRELVVGLSNRIRNAGFDDFRIDTRERVVLDRTRIVPERVVRRVDEVRGHPHGGPPGQIKKEIGVQTGAEVVHGTHPGQDRKAVGDRAIPERRMDVERSDRGKPGAKPKKDRGGPPPHANAQRGKAKGNDHPDNGNGKGKNRGDR